MIRKFLRRFFIFLSWFLFSLLALTIVFALLLFFKPQVFVNQHTLPIAQRILDQKGIQVRWKSFSFDTKRTGFLDRDLLVKIDSPCIQYESLQFHACFDLIDVAIAVNFKNLDPLVKRVDRFIVQGGNVNWVLKESSGKEEEKKKTAKSEKSSGPKLPDWVRALTYGPVQVEIPRILVSKTGKDQNMKIAADFELINSPSSNQPQLASELPWTLHLRETLGTQSKNPKKKTALDHTAELLARFENLGGEWNLKTNLNSKFKDGKKIRLATHLSQARGHQPWVLGLEGKFEPGRSKDKPFLKAVTVSKCLFEYRSRNQFGPSHLGTQSAGTIARNSKNQPIEDEDFSMNCPLEFDLTPPVFKELERVTLPRRVSSRIEGQFSSEDLLDTNRPLKADLTWTMDPVQSRIYVGDARIGARFQGVPSQSWETWDLHVTPQIDLVIPQFQKVVAELSQGIYAVPAPFNVLDGELKVGVSGEFDTKQGSFPLFLTTRLASQKQSLDVDAHADLSFKKTEKALFPKVAGKVVLSRVQFVLPRLDLESPPRIMPDPRFSKKAAESKKKSNFEYDLTVDTPEGSPVKLISNLAKKPIPVQIHLALQSEKPVSGSIYVEDFPLKIFRRDAQVEKFALQLAPIQGPESKTLDGSIRVEYTDYIVHILLNGTTEKPQVKLVSDPYVPQDQLIAVLLFGRTLDELDPDQTESVGNTRAALANSAVSLASMYFLASTPIESIGYDPSTNGLSAKVHLGEGTSLNVGTSATDTAQIGIRKRLSKRWTIRTDINSLRDSQGQSLSAFLEWNNRY